MRMQKKEQEAHKILEKHLPYYMNLSFVDKVEFRKRVNRFIRNMKFRGGKNFAIGFIKNDKIGTAPEKTIEFPKSIP